MLSATIARRAGPQGLDASPVQTSPAAPRLASPGTDIKEPISGRLSLCYNNRPALVVVLHGLSAAASNLRTAPTICPVAAVIHTDHELRRTSRPRGAARADATHEVDKTVALG